MRKLEVEEKLRRKEKDKKEKKKPERRGKDGKKQP